MGFPKTIFSVITMIATTARTSTLMRIYKVVFLLSPSKILKGIILAYFSLLCIRFVFFILIIIFWEYHFSLKRNSGDVFKSEV